MLLFTMSCMLEAYCFEQWFLFLEGVLGNTISLCRILSNFVFRASSLDGRVGCTGWIVMLKGWLSCTMFVYRCCVPPTSVPLHLVAMKNPSSDITFACQTIHLSVLLSRATVCFAQVFRARSLTQYEFASRARRQMHGASSFKYHTRCN